MGTERSDMIYNSIFELSANTNLYLFQIRNQIRNKNRTKGKIVWETFLLLKSELLFIRALF